MSDRKHAELIRKALQSGNWRDVYVRHVDIAVRLTAEERRSMQEWIASGRRKNA